MQSANSLLNMSSSNVVPNIQSTNPLYNPAIPVIGDSNNVRNLRNIKMKDRFYLDNAMDGQMKNSDGLSLGANNKFLRRNNYDRQIDPNYLRRENPINRKHTDIDDFYNGSELAYFELPRRIPRAQIVDPMSINAINPMNAYQYRNRFLDNSNVSKPVVKPIVKPVIETDKPKTPDKPKAPIKTNLNDNKTNLNDNKTIGNDPTEDPDIIKIKNQLEKERGESIVNRNINKAQNTPKDLNTEIKDKYGKPTIRTPIKVGPKRTGISVGNF
jgi:hypothetical protein